MPNGHISVSELQACIEHKAFAYGTSGAVATLIGEYVVELLRSVAKTSSTIPQSQ